jgi:hypothetical protein
MASVATTEDGSAPSDGHSKGHHRAMTHRGRLKRFYEKHAPEKVATIDKALRAYDGRESAMYRLLRKKYGPDPILEEVLGPSPRGEAHGESTPLQLLPGESTPLAHHHSRENSMDFNSTLMLTPGDELPTLHASAIEHEPEGSHSPLPELVAESSLVAAAEVAPPTLDDVATASPDAVEAVEANARGVLETLALEAVTAAHGTFLTLCRVQEGIARTIAEEATLREAIEGTQAATAERLAQRHRRLLELAEKCIAISVVGVDAIAAVQSEWRSFDGPQPGDAVPLQAQRRGAAPGGFREADPKAAECIAAAGCAATRCAASTNGARRNTTTSAVTAAVYTRPQCWQPDAPRGTRVVCRAGLVRRQDRGVNAALSLAEAIRVEDRRVFPS